MIKRIVQLSLQEGCFSDFVQIFETSKPTILGSFGAISVDMWQDIHHPDIVFTYSQWKKAEDLEHYRNSDFFLATWKRLKPMFAHKAQAWTVKDYFNA